MQNCGPVATSPEYVTTRAGNAAIRPAKTATEVLYARAKLHTQSHL